MFTTICFLKEVPTVWVVERLDVDGEELPVIRHAETWLPAPIALRYVLRTRFRLGAASLTNDLRAIAILYNWAEATEGVGDFENFLTSGQVLRRDQLLTLIPHLQCRRYYETLELHDIYPDRVARPSLVSDQTFNTRLFAVRQFLKWAIEPAHHGGCAILDEDERDEYKVKLVGVFEDETLPVGDSSRREPLTIAEIQLIREAIMPDKSGNFPPNVFTKTTRFRNWIMFETALNLGVRKGEMLTLRVEHVPTNEDEKFFFVPRQQDTREDPRKRRRLRGKTSERRVPLMEPKLMRSILGYRNAAPPIGRNEPRFTTPYLFVTGKGRPISNSTADYIIRQIGRYAVRLLDRDSTVDEQTLARRKGSLLTLTWHRLRHTWAELAAMSLYRKHGEGAWTILKEWGGWKSEESMRRYVEYARSEISEQAIRDYIASYRKESLS